MSRLRPDEPPAAPQPPPRLLRDRLDDWLTADERLDVGPMDARLTASIRRRAARREWLDLHHVPTTDRPRIVPIRPTREANP